MDNRADELYGILGLYNIKLKHSNKADSSNWRGVYSLKFRFQNEKSDEVIVRLMKNFFQKHFGHLLNPIYVSNLKSPDFECRECQVLVGTDTPWISEASIFFDLNSLTISEFKKYLESQKCFS